MVMHVNDILTLDQVLAYITFGSAFYGYDSGITTSVLAYENFIEYFALNVRLLSISITLDMF